MQTSQSAPVTPDRLMQLTWGFAGAQLLCTAVDLDLFTHVAQGRATRPALAEATRASARGLGMLVNALVGLGLLTRAGEGESARYALAPDVAQFLVRGQPAYIGDFIQFHIAHLQEGWQQLTDSVRTGEPMKRVERPEDGVPLWHQLVDALFPLNYGAAARLAQELKRRHPGAALRILDVAAGSGVWGIAAAQADPKTRVVALDLAETLEHARTNARRLQLADRIELRAGDLREVALGEREFDAVILGHILHSEGARQGRKLIEKAARALKPGGTLAIAEFVPNDDRSTPPLPLMFALNMLVHTAEGDTFTLAEMSGWLRESGFTDVTTLEAPAPSPLILARRSS